VSHFAPLQRPGQFNSAVLSFLHDGDRTAFRRGAVKGA